MPSSLSEKTIRAAMLGKLGIGKTSLINNLLGEDIGKTSSSVAQGCTTGVHKYGPGRKPQAYEVYDTEGTFGVKDNLGEVVTGISGQLEGKTLHAMCCCISVQHISRVDQDTMLAVQMCAGVVGEQNVEKLLIVFTYVNDAAAEQKAHDIFETLKQAVDLVMRGSKEKKIERMRPLAKLMQDDRLQYVVTSKDDVSQLEEVLGQFGELEPATAKPDDWTKNEDECEEFLTDVLRQLLNAFWPVIDSLVPMPFRPAAAAGKRMVEHVMGLFGGASKGPRR